MVAEDVFDVGVGKHEWVGKGSSESLAAHRKFSQL